MTNRKNTRRALVMSALSLLLCCAMLVGTTFAWFTDSVTSARNTIQAGNLDVVLEYWDGDSYEEVTSATKLFNDAALWEPGYTEVAYLKVSNAGTLALKYQLSVNVYDEVIGKTADGKDIKLSDHLVFSVVEKELASEADEYTREAARTAAGNAMGLKSYNSGTKALQPKTATVASDKEDYIALIIYMPETVANEANHDGVNVPSIELGVDLYATQVEAEDDSFGTDYDKDAWDKALKVTSMDELKLALDTVEDGGLIVFGNDIADTDGALLTDKNVTIDLNGNTFTVSEGASTSNRVFKITGNSNVVIKNGTLIANGTTDAGAYGTIRTEGAANVTLENLKLYNYRGGGLNVKAVSGTTVTINNCEIYSQYGGGVEASGGNIVLNNTKIEQKGVYNNGWYSVAMEINSSGTITVNSGEYSGSAIATDANAAAGNCVAFILSSGGTLTINGGTFNAVVAETAAASNFCGLIYADRAAVVNINGGTFNSNGAILDMRNNAGSQPNPKATLAGGTFSADPRVSGLYASNLITVADGHAATQNADGTWTVDREYTVVTPAAGASAADNGAELANAINTSATPYIQLGEGEYKMPSVGTTKELTIVGTKETVINNTMGAYMESATVTFEGVTIKGSTGMANGNGSDYAAFYSQNVTYINCTFDGPFRIGRDGATFIGCTFTNLGNDYVWTYGNDCTFENCTFNTEGKALLIYSDGGNEVSKVTVKNCTFNSTKGGTAWAIANQNCAAIEIQNYGNGVDLVTSGNTFDSNFSGEWRIKSYHAAQPAVIINGTTYTTIAVDGKPMTIDADRNVTIQ